MLKLNVLNTFMLSMHPNNLIVKVSSHSAPQGVPESHVTV